MSLVLSNKGKGMQSSSEQPLVGEERYVTTRITAAKESTEFDAYQALGLDALSKYSGKASVRCFIGVSKHTHVAKLVYFD